MEPKDLNTFITNKLNEGSGLRYKEEYWNDMNSLLDANMPVAKAGGPETNSATQTTTTGFKLSYLISACAATVAGFIVYFQLFNAPTSVSTENNNPSNSNHTPETSQPISPETSSVPQHTQTASSNTDAQNTGHTVENNGAIQPSNTTTNLSHQKQDQTSAISANNLNASNLNSPENTFTPTTRRETSDALTTTPQPTEHASEGPFMTTQSDQQVSNHTTDLILIEPMSHAPNTHQMNAITESSVPPPLLPKRNQLIQHIDVSPFAGMILETGEQTYQSGNTLYKHSSQSHMVYGINVECATKQFSVRTGIGMSRTSLQSNTTSSENIYDVDTSFIIVNPNYGTTPSGKPIVLVQRKLDSSLVSTQYTTTPGNITYQYLTIPLTLQYKIAYKRFSLILEGGGLHHIMVSQQKDGPQQIQTENAVALPAYSFQLTAGSSVRYAITSKWAVGIQYNYNLNPSSANLHFLNNSHAAVFMITRSIR